MKILIDSNVIFDVFERRQPHYSASNHLLKLVRRGVAAGAVASHTVANLFYVYERPCLDFLKESLLPHCEVVAGDAHQTLMAMRTGMKDFEDCLQSAAAMAWKASFIVTRNVKDFRLSAVPAISPNEWCARFGPSLQA